MQRLGLRPHLKYRRRLVHLQTVGDSQPLDALGVPEDLGWDLEVRRRLLPRLQLERMTQLRIELERGVGGRQRAEDCTPCLQQDGLHKYAM